LRLQKVVGVHDIDLGDADEESEGSIGPPLGMPGVLQALHSRSLTPLVVLVDSTAILVILLEDMNDAANCGCVRSFMLFSLPS
jgi:hypothetical protein